MHYTTFRILSEWTVQAIKPRSQHAAAVASLLGGQLTGESGGAEQAQHRAGGVVPGPGQRVTDVLKPAQFCHAGPAVPGLGLADERDGRAGGAGPRPASERQDVDLVADLMLPACHGRRASQADIEAGLIAGIAGYPLGGQRLKVRPE